VSEFDPAFAAHTGPRIEENSRQLYEAYEREHFAQLQSLIEGAGLSLKDVMLHVGAFMRRRELARLCSHYELFKLVEHLPGSIVELGVFLGGGFFTWSKLMETFCPGDRGRKVYGFESLKGYEDFRPEDERGRNWVNRLIGRMAPTEAFLDGMVELHNKDNFLRGVERCCLLKGDILETVPAFAKNNLGTRISLLYFDCNLYAPTLCGLRHLMPLMVPGGVVAFNAYGVPPWEGEAKGIEDYFAEVGQKPPQMRKFPFSIYPNAFFVV
jgi:hypothetical protein